MHATLGPTKVEVRRTSAGDAMQGDPCFLIVCVSPGLRTDSRLAAYNVHSLTDSLHSRNTMLLPIATGIPKQSAGSSHWRLCMSGRSGRPRFNFASSFIADADAWKQHKQEHTHVSQPDCLWQQHTPSQVQVAAVTDTKPANITANPSTCHTRGYCPICPCRQMTNV